MEWLAKQFGRALVRRVAFVVVLALLGWAGIGRADAACSGNICDTRDEAYALVTAAMNDWIANNPPNPQSPSVKKACIWRRSPTANIVHGSVTQSSSVCPTQGLTNPTPSYASAIRQWVSDCPVGSVWNDFLNRCDSACSTKPPLGPTIGLLQMEVCVGGCKYAGVPTKQISLESGPSGSIDFGAFSGFTPTGEQCGTPDQAKPEPYCAPINGQTVCVRPDGSHCHKSATTKRFFCWRPGETGEKADGPDVSKTNAGPEAIPPSVSLPNGDTLTPAGPPVTTTTNIGGNTTTTTTNNYTTEHGTNAAPGKGQGVGDDSGPGDGEGEGDGDGDGKGSGSGGGDCDTPPSCSGNAIACWAVEVNWKQACNSRDSGIVGLNEMSDALNAATAAEAINWGATLGSDGEGDMHLTRGTRTIDPDDLDASGFLGAGSCPVLPTATVGGRSLPIDMTKICEFLSNLSGFVLAVAYLLAFRIIGGGGRR